MKRNGLFVLATTGLAALLYWGPPAAAQGAGVAPTLGAAQQFGVLGGSAVTGSTGSGTVVNGDVGSYPTPTISNFPPSSTSGSFIVHRTADGVVQQAQSDARTAYNFLAGQGGGTLPLPTPDELAGRTLTAGVYAMGAANLAASTSLTLDGPGVFIFNVSSTLVMNTSSVVIGTADPCNVYWRVGTSATLNGNSFMGTVIADVSITVGGGSVAGRVLALTGAVTMPTGGNTIGGCSTAPPACPTITLSPSTLPNGAIGVAYSQPIVATGGAGPFTFAVTSGTLPAGLTLTAAGVLAGTPTTAGPYTFTITATDPAGCSASITYTVTVVAAVCPVITLTPPALPTGRVGVAYSQQITPSGGTGAYVFSVLSGTLPAGLTLSAGGLLAGTPTTVGSSTVTIRATDANGCPADVVYTILVAAAACPVISVAPPTLPAGAVGVAYSQQITASGGTGSIAFTVLSGTLPAGLTLSSGGLLSGTPTTAGPSTVSIQAHDGDNCPGVVSYTITIAAAVPTLPQVFVVVLALGLTGIGYVRLRRQARG